MSTAQIGFVMLGASLLIPWFHYFAPFAADFNDMMWADQPDDKVFFLQDFRIEDRTCCFFLLGSTMKVRIPKMANAASINPTSNNAWYSNASESAVGRSGIHVKCSYSDSKEQRHRDQINDKNKSDPIGKSLIFLPFMKASLCLRMSVVFMFGLSK